MLVIDILLQRQSFVTSNDRRIINDTYKKD